MRAIVRVSAACFLVCACATWAWGNVATWTGGASTANWGDALNWSTSAVPTSATDVIIPDGAPATISFGANRNFRSLTVTKGDGDLTLTKGAGGIDYAYSSTPVVYNPSGSTPRTLIYDSTNIYFWQSGAPDPVFEVDGQNTYRFDPGTFSLDNASPSAVKSMTKIGTGTMRIKGGGYFPDAVNVSAGTLIVGFYGVDSSKTVASFGPKDKGHTATVNIASGATFQFDCNVIFIDTNNPSGGGTTLSNGILGNFAGSGLIKMTCSTPTLTDCGASFSPGVSSAAGVGVLSVQGGLTFGLVDSRCTMAGTANNPCVLNIDITGGGTVAGTDFDQLAVSGTVATIGNCNLVVNAIGAVAGNSYAFLTSGNSQATANFRNVTVNNIPTGLSYAVAPIASGLGYQISFVPEPATMSVLVLGGLFMLKRRK